MTDPRARWAEILTDDPASDRTEAAITNADDTAALDGFATDSDRWFALAVEGYDVQDGIEL